MEHITISKFMFDTIIESVEDMSRVLNKVDYDSDPSDPKNIEHCPAYAVGYSKTTIDSILFNLNTIIQENNS